MNKENRKQLVERLECAEVTVRAVKEQLAAMDDETYSIGDRFTSTPTKWLLATQGLPEVGMVSLTTGERWDIPRKVTNCNNITGEEMQEICSSGAFTRYWNNKKKLYVNGYTKENH